MTPIELRFSYTPEDYIRTQTFLRNFNKPNSVIINVGGLFIVAVAVIDVFIALQMIGSGNREAGYPLLVLSVPVGVFMCAAVYRYNIPLQLLIYKWRVKRNYSPDSFLYAERALVFSEDGIEETHEFGRYLMRWAAIERVVETGDDFYFYLPNAAVRFQPKRNLSTEQTDALRILIKANLKENAEYQSL